MFSRLEIYKSRLALGQLIWIATPVLFIYRVGVCIFSVNLLIGSLQRHEIVNGVVEVEGVTSEACVDQEEDKATEGT